MAHLLGQIGGLFHALHIAEKFVDAHQTPAAENAFVGNASKLAQQVLQQANFQRISRGEIGVPSLGGDGAVALPGPHQEALTETSTGPYYGDRVPCHRLAPAQLV